MPEGAMMMMMMMMMAAVSGKSYQTHSKVPVLVNNVGPFNNPAEAYRFYSLPYCAPAEEKDHDHHLGEVLAGDRKAHSPYDVRFKVDVQWQALCRITLTPSEVDQFIEAIKQHYIFEMFVDDLPVKGFVGETEVVTSKTNIGINSTHAYLFTHLDFSISYNDGNVIAANLTTDPEQRMEIKYGQEAEIEFSFGIHWHHTATEYHDRNHEHSRSLINDQPVEIHWLSIINSFVLVVLLTSLIGIIFMRVLKKDFARYMEIDEEDFDEQSDSGWKLVHGDVFRPPENAMLLSAFVGTGCQIFVFATCLIGLSLVGMFYPGNRGSLYTAAVVIYALTAGIAGYISTTMYVQLGGEKWATNAVVTALVFAVPFFSNFVIVNSMALYYGSIAAMPMRVILTVIVLWALVTFPLTVLGSLRARNTKPMEVPCKTNRAAREIPPQPWWRNLSVAMILSGFLPFSAIYIELHYIFASIWGHRVYTLFEILALAFVMLLLVNATVSVALTYFQLASEDYHWWWRSFFSGASTGIFIYGYAIFYFNNRSEMSGTLQATYFFGYAGLIAYAFALMLGAAGFLVSQRFVRHIYGSIKID